MACQGPHLLFMGLDTFLQLLVWTKQLLSCLLGSRHTELLPSFKQIPFPPTAVLSLLVPSTGDITCIQAPLNILGKSHRPSQPLALGGLRLNALPISSPSLCTPSTIALYQTLLKLPGHVSPPKRQDKPLNSTHMDHGLKTMSVCMSPLSD